MNQWMLKKGCVKASSFSLLLLFGFMWSRKQSAVQCLIHRILSKILTQSVKLNLGMQMTVTKSCTAAGKLLI